MLDFQSAVSKVYLDSIDEWWHQKTGIPAPDPSLKLSREDHVRRDEWISEFLLEIE